MVSPTSLPTTYGDITTVVSLVSQTAILVLVTQLKALIPDPTAGISGTSPDFDNIPPEMATKLRAELVALDAAIDAAPTV